MLEAAPQRGRVSDLHKVNSLRRRFRNDHQKISNCQKSHFDRLMDEAANDNMAD